MLANWQTPSSWANAQFVKDRDSTKGKGCPHSQKPADASFNCSFQVT